jgi:D-arabinose 1-dehydrogenase-like Zn-dependent alcohol dehydrogenase
MSRVDPPFDARQLMQAVRLHAEGGQAELSLDEIEVPRPGPGEVLVRVHAAAITRDELEWPVDRLPAIPSYEVSGRWPRSAPTSPTSRWATRSSV